jgi:hypothetical protein
MSRQHRSGLHHQAFPRGTGRIFFILTGKPVLYELSIESGESR